MFVPPIVHCRSRVCARLRRTAAAHVSYPFNSPCGTRTRSHSTTHAHNTHISQPNDMENKSDNNSTADDAMHGSKHTMPQVAQRDPVSVHAASSDVDATTNEPDDDVVTPWEVRAGGPRGIDYDRVLTRFRAARVDDEVRQSLISAIKHRSSRSADSNRGNNNNNNNNTGRCPNDDLHHFFTRDVVLSHRDFAAALVDMTRDGSPGSVEGASPARNEPIWCASTTDSPDDASTIADEVCATRGSHDDSARTGLVYSIPAYLYTGRGPSATSMHLGHAVPFVLTHYLQRVLHLPVVIQITDDEKFLFRGTPFAGPAAETMIRNNIKDIIAFGFDPRRTFIFRNTHYMGHMYPTVLLLQRALTVSAVSNSLGLRGGDCVGKLSFPATQAAPCFATTFAPILPTVSVTPSSPHAPAASLSSDDLPLDRDGRRCRRSSPSAAARLPRCIVPCAIDQDPFFLLTRAVAQRGLLARSGAPPPAVLHTRFLPALKGMAHKMSSSAVQNGVIALSDSDVEVRAKLRRAFSGGCGSLRDMRRCGADLDTDVAYHVLRVFGTDADEWQEVTARYRSGAMHSGEVKERAAEAVLRDFLRAWRARRAAVSDADVAHFCSIRRMEA